jgi:CBS domain-containing protein
MDVARLVEQRQGAIHSCIASDLVSAAARLLADKRIGALPVLDGDRVVGIFSERDLLYGIAKEGSAALDKTVGEVMTAPPITVDLATSAIEALELMTRRRVRHLPVVEDGRMVGLVSIGDLVKLRLEMVQAEAEAMRAYIQTA